MLYMLAKWLFGGLKENYLREYSFEWCWRLRHLDYLRFENCAPFWSQD